MSLYAWTARSINGALDRVGYRVTRLPTQPTNCRLRAIERLSIDLVLDVGANAGQYARELRRYGYSGRIISFEPLPDVFAILAAAADGDRLWEARNVAAGDVAERLTMHVSDNSVSSSLLPVTAASVAAAPASRASGTVEVEVVRLEDLLAAETGARIMLKIDAQGYEWPVLQGCGSAIDHVRLLDVEMSLKPMYEGQALFDQVDSWVVAHGFGRVGFDTGFWNRTTGELLQLDGIYARENVQRTAE